MLLTWSTGCRPLIPEPVLVITIFQLAVAEYLRRGVLRQRPALPLISQVLAVLTCAAMTGGYIAYMAQTFSLPLQDNAFLLLDRLVGFEWLSFQKFVHANPMLMQVLGWAYDSFFCQITLAPICLILVGQAHRADRYISAYLLTQIIVLTINAMMPTLGQAGMIEPHHATLLLSGATPLVDLYALRNGSMRLIDLTSVGGMISFPSLHCAIAYLATAAMWSIRVSRVPMVLLNVVMVTSAVTHGAHFLSDCVAGIAISALCFHVTGDLSLWSRTWLGTFRRWMHSAFWTPRSAAGCSGTSRLFAASARR